MTKDVRSWFVRPDLRRVMVVSFWTDQYQYPTDQVLDEMIERCDELKLYVDCHVEDVRRDALVMLTV